MRRSKRDIWRARREIYLDYIEPNREAGQGLILFTFYVNHLLVFHGVKEMMEKKTSLLNFTGTLYEALLFLYIN